MNTNQPANTLGIPTTFTIELGMTTIVALGVMLIIWVGHKQILGR